MKDVVHHLGKPVHVRVKLKHHIRDKGELSMQLTLTKIAKTKTQTISEKIRSSLLPLCGSSCLSVLGLANAAQMKLASYVNTVSWEILSLILLLINTITLALDEYPVTAASGTYSDINYALIILFFIELMFKIIANGFSHFLDAGNSFDAIIVFLSFQDVIVNPVNNAYLSALRSFRIYRMFQVG